MRTCDIIRSLMTEQNVTIDMLHNRTGLALSTLSRYINGKTGIPLTRLPLFAEAFGVSQEYLMGWSSEPYSSVMNKHARFEIVLSVKCGYGSQCEEDFSGEFTDISSAELRGYPVSECAVVRASGKSMEPAIWDGDLVIVHKQESVDDGDIAIIGIGDEEATLKKVEKTENALTLVPYNEDYPVVTYRGKTLQLVRIYGKVIGQRRKW